MGAPILTIIGVSSMVLTSSRRETGAEVAKSLVTHVNTCWHENALGSEAPALATPTGYGDCSFAGRLVQSLVSTHPPP